MIAKDDVRHIARLARLEVSDADIDMLTTQLGDILRYASEVQRIDTTDIAPTSHAFTTDAPWREDLVVPSLDRAEVLANAPDADRAAGLFRVPKVR